MAQQRLRLEDAIGAYNGERERTRKLAAQSLVVQRKVLDQFERCVGGYKWMSQVGAGEFERFFYGAEGSSYVGAIDRLSSNTFNNYRAWVVGFEKWSRYKGHIREHAATKDGTWMCDIPSLPKDEKDHRRLSEAEYYAALDAAETYEVRDRAMMAVGMILATRGSECASLRISSLTRSKGEIKVRITKGVDVHSRISTVALAPALVAELEPWLEAYARNRHVSETVLMSRDDWLLFPSRHVAGNWGRESIVTYNPALQAACPHRIVQRHLRAIGIVEKHLGFHTLRRSGARLLYEHAKAMGAGDPLRIVQVHLNHVDRATTLKYIGLAPDIEERDVLLMSGDYLLAPRHRPGANVVMLRQRK